MIGEALDTQGESGRSDQAAEPEADGTQAGFGEDFPLISAAVGGLEAFGSSDQRFEHGLALMITGLRARHDPGWAGPEAADPGAAEATAAGPGAVGG